MHIAGVAAAQETTRPEALLEELHVAQISRVQEKGEIQLTLALSSQKEGGSFLRDSIAGQFEVELGVTERLQLSLEAAVLDRSSLSANANDVEVGAAYELFRGSKSNLIVGVDSRPNHLHEMAMRVTSGLKLRRAEIHSGLAVEREEGERKLALDVAAIWPWANWRGTLEIHHESGTSSIVPGVAWTRHGVQLGVGVELPSGDESMPRPMFNTTWEL
jgi:hypothetical protein